MKQRLHEVRRSEVYGRFIKALEPVDPSTQKEWDEVRAIAFQAAYDYYDATGPQDQHEYDKGKNQAIEAMLDYHLVGDRDSAEEEFMLMDDMAREMSSEVHASDYDRERLHSVKNRHLPRPAPITPKHDPMVGTAPTPRPFVESAAPRPLLSITHQPAKEPSLSERTQNYFTQVNRRFWDNNDGMKTLQAVYDASGLTGEDVHLALYEKCKNLRPLVTHVPKVGEFSASVEEVQDFLEKHQLTGTATQAWMLKQYEDKYVALASEVASTIGLTPGAPQRGQWEQFDAEFQHRWQPFEETFTNEQYGVVGLTGDEASTFARDVAVLRGSLQRALKEYVNKGPDIERGRSV